MWNPDITIAGAIKTFAIMSVGAVTVSGWLWTSAAWKTEVDLKLDNLAANNIKLEEKMDKGFDRIDIKFDKMDGKFDKIDKKIERNFDLLMTEIRSLKK